MTEVEGTHVEVHTDPPAEAPPAEDHTTVVVADSGDGGIHPALAQFMQEQAAFNAEILARMDNTSSTAESAAATAESAAAATDTVVEDAAALVAQAQEATDAGNASSAPPEDIDPSKSEHIWYRH